MSEKPRHGAPTIRPKALEEGLIVREVAGETLVYDARRQRMHCLAPALAAVWRSCNGRRTPSEIADRVGSVDGATLGPADVRVAIARLRRARLVEVAPAPPGSSRRDVLRATALAGLTLATLAAPRAGEAASCISLADCNRLNSGGGPGGGCGGLPCCDVPGQACKAKGEPGKPCGCST